MARTSRRVAREAGREMHSKSKEVRSVAGAALRERRKGSARRSPRKTR
jgi:hypothetical protein